MGGKMKELIRKDVLVVGGGPAGIGAALASARRGAQTLLIERHAFFGGIASFCVGMCINQMRPGGQSRSAVHELLIEKLRAYGDRAAFFRDENILKHALFCNVEYLKVAILDALDAVGCGYLVHTRCVDSLVAKGRITGVVVATKNGLAEIRAKRVVDCTGDADVAYFAGAETMKDKTGSPMTLCFNVTNVDMQAAQKVGSDRERMAEMARRAKGKYPLVPDRWGLGRFPSSSCFYINHAGTRVLGPMDPTDPQQLTRAECTSRRQVLQMVDAMREFGGEALEEIEIITTGPQIGIRETRRVKGVYTLTEEDSLSGRKFEDGIAWRSGVLDIGFVRTEPMPTHDVPFRSILPQKLDGLLVGGRCISTDHAAASAGKSMGNCIATGHAAGAASALSIKENCMPRELDVKKVREALRQDGVDLDRAGEKAEYPAGAGAHWRRGEEWKR
jgi:ribulose 1,5-bisphosphate synthetase/thiazole synthase